MIHFFKKEKFPTILFVVAAMITFLVVGLLFVFLAFSGARERMSSDSERIDPSRKYDRYYLKEYQGNKDPYVTDVASLEDILAGPIITTEDPNLGNLEAPVNIVIFSDFICSFCAEQELVIKKIMEKYPNQIRFVWKDYPESNENSVSWQAAIAARCAQRQGKFWAYHESLYRYNSSLTLEALSIIAEQQDLDIKDFNQCFVNDETQNAVIANVLEADALDISGIPFIYVNDQQVMGTIDETELSRLVDIELKKVNSKNE